LGFGEVSLTLDILESVEVIEVHNADGTISAYTSGGQQVVTITQIPEREEREFYNPSMGADARAGKPRWKTYTVPTAFHVKHNGGTEVVSDYSKAVQLAVSYAQM
jgi:hypothetical protein